jgi:hypothetical protein
MVSVLADVVGEERHLALDEKFLEHDVPHGHGQRGVRPGLGGEPFVRELRVVRVVRADRHHLGAAVPDLGHPVRVRGPGDGDVGAPHHEVARVPPVTGFRDVGLVTEDLRAGHGEVGVPVVEGRHHPADELDEAGSDGVRHHGHRGDRREAGAAVRSVGLDGVDVRGCGDFDGFLPGDPYQAALAAGLLVAAAAFGVPDDVGEGQHRVAEPGLGFAVHFDEDAPGVGEADARGRVGVPGERSPARAAPRLVFRAVRPHGGVVGLLGFPGDDAVLDVHLPGTGARAVHSVRGADHLVMAPPVTVEDIALAAALPEHRPAVVGLVPFREKTAQLQHCI